MDRITYAARTAGRRPRALIAIAIAALLLTATGVQTTAALSTNAPQLKVGMSYGSRLSRMSGTTLNATFDDAVKLGVTWVRDDLSWATVESRRGTYDWTAFDAVVASATAHGLSVLPILDFTPAWARPAGCTSQACAPLDSKAFASFARAAVKRYAPKNVHTWEIWNEPNMTGFWQPAPDALAYGRLISATSAAIKGADGRASVISGGLAPTATAGGNIEQRTYLTALCATGGLLGADAVGVHPYSSPVLPSVNEDWNAFAQMSVTNVSVRTVLNDCGAGSKPLWATEFGAPTGGPGALSTLAEPNLAANPDHVDEATQAAILDEGVRRTVADPSVSALFVYTDRDLGTAPTTVENFFGLRRGDGSAKPAWSAFQAAVLKARSAR
jgi:hypothetical protein